MLPRKAMMWWCFSHLYWLLLVAGLILTRPPKIWAQTQAPVVFQEDFSQGFTQWQLDKGHWEWWEIIDEQARGYVQWQGRQTYLVPQDSLWDEQWQALEFEFDFRPEKGHDRNITWGYQDPGTWYNLQFIPGQFYLVRKQNKNLLWAASGNYNLVNGQTYHFKIAVQGPAIKLWINEQLIKEFTDPSYDVNSAGKFALRVATGAVVPVDVYWDNLVIRNLTKPTAEPVQLDVPLFSQVDPAWAAQEYNQARNWSQQPTIKRWGCALSSLAMIMRFYGLNWLPDGTELTPATLNIWLKEQPDGYVGEGLLNWLAAMRLASQISEQYSTVEQLLPKLEYSQLKIELSTELPGQFLPVIAQLDLGQPVILQIPGHFLVADGYPADQQDLFIKDPAFVNYQLFSEHQTELLSTRIFTPSQTDLSYLLMVYPVGLQVELKNALGELVSNTQLMDDHLQDMIDQSGESSPQYLQQFLAQPAAGAYVIELSQPNLGPFNLEIYAYDQQGELSYWQEQGWVGQQPLQFGLTYQTNGSSELTPLVDFNFFRQVLTELLFQQQLSKYYAWHQLDRLTGYAQQAELAAQQRYLQLLAFWLGWYQQHLTKAALAYLQYLLSLLAD
ncbi:MAG: hypothetical protein GF390_00820 [Candidatus Pacebacteria bacterium]|nr:hypothetical protein [Candidatus Paceibacterota bacterium]